MNELFGKTESQSLAILMVLIAIVLADIIIHLYSRRKGNYKLKRKTGKEQNDLLKLLEADDESFVLLRKNNKIPVYVSDNIRDKWGVKAESIYADNSTIARGFSEEDKRKLMELEQSWDGKTPLVYQAVWKVNDIKNIL